MYSSDRIVLCATIFNTAVDKRSVKEAIYLFHMGTDMWIASQNLRTT